VRSLRAALEERQQKLEHELEQMEHIQEKFASIHNQLELQAQGSPATNAAATAARESGGGFQTAAEREIESTAVAMRASQEMAAEIKRANAGTAHHSPGKSFGSPQKRIPLGEMRNSVDFGR
jgi:peptidoglycan hydrolase CwlO-like protein